MKHRIASAIFEELEDIKKKYSGVDSYYTVLGIPEVFWPTED